MASSNSDVDAVKALKNILEKKGYKIRNKPKEGYPSGCADVFASKSDDQDLYYFEVKKTSAKDNIFGASTTNQWKVALQEEGHYYFVIAIERNGSYKFYAITPKDFIRYMIVPPIKFDFNIPFISKDDNGDIVFFRPGRKCSSKLVELDTISETIKQYEALSGKKNIVKESAGNDFMPLNELI